MDIQILDIAELLLFVLHDLYLYKDIQTKETKRKNIVKNVNYVFDKPYILWYGNRNELSSNSPGRE